MIDAPAAESEAASRPPDLDGKGPADASRGGLRGLAVRGALWTLSAHGLRQTLRLGGSLVLTRLLFEEAFGYMALVQVVLRGLQMLSDVGVSGSVVRSPRGDDPAYLNTAWTLKIVRGVLLWLVACLLAWPVAEFYDKPMLFALIPVAGLSGLLLGFSSPHLLTLQRHLQLRPLVTLELSVQVIGLALTITLAFLLRSVWALVIGELVRSVLQVTLSYVAFDAPRPKFMWEREAAVDMYRFGRWIFLSTAITFLLQQGDKAILGALLPTGVLGVYAIAVVLARAPVQALQAINRRVMFPVYSRVVLQRPHLLRSRLRQARARLMLIFLPPLWALIFFGPSIVNLLYPERFSEAGWMVQWLAVGACGTVIATTAGGVLLSKGDSLRYMWLQVWRGVAMIAGFYIGYQVAGFPGLVAGGAIARWTDYPMLAFSVHKHGAWLPKLDAIAYGSTAVVIALRLVLGAAGGGAA